jgi:hypothetical protein
MNPQWKAIGTVIGRPKGGRFVRIYFIVIPPRAVHVRGVPVDESIEIEDRIATRIGGVRGKMRQGGVMGRREWRRPGEVGWSVSAGGL